MGRVEIFVIVSLLIFVRTCEQDYYLGTPTTKTPQTVITHNGFKLSYNEQYEQADWVAYELTAEETDGYIERTGDFREDPNVTTGSATLDDYKYSGYDRGHLIPAGDVRWSREAMSSSFLLSNMSPQDPGFNRGDWRMLESQVRKWARNNKSVHIVTGPALKQGIIGSIGPSKVAVPRYYYKAILDVEEPELKAIGFNYAQSVAYWRDSRLCRNN